MTDTHAVDGDTTEEEDGQSPFWRLVKIAALIAVALITLMVAAVLFSELTATDETETFNVTEPVEIVQIETVSGQVRVEGAQIDHVEVVRTSHYSIVEPDGAVDVDGATLTLTDGCARSILLIPNCSVDFEVRVPLDTVVEIDGERTDVTIDGVIGPINIDTTAADVALIGARGPITILAEGSDVVGTELSGPGTTIMTTDGSIELDFLERPDVIAAKTTVGPVSVVVPQAPYAVEVEAANGDVDIAVVNDPTSERRISITNSVGNVSVLPRP